MISAVVPAHEHAAGAAKKSVQAPGHYRDGVTTKIHTGVALRIIGGGGCCFAAGAEVNVNTPWQTGCIALDLIVAGGDQMRMVE